MTLQRKLVKHARRLVVQLAEVAVPREFWERMLGRIGNLVLESG